MKILFLNIWMHKKNMNALLNYKNIQLEIINNIKDIDNFDLTTFDCIYSPSTPIDISKYPNTRFIFGPHFSVFPDNKLLLIQSPNVSYIVLSEWNKKIWKSYEFCKILDIVDIHFGVETNKFIELIPIKERNKIFIYYKDRNPKELELIEQKLKFNNIEYKIFHYKQGYHENGYLKYLQESKFGIWLGRHESQGFALEEALSCNVPLLVWDVSSMNQEFGQNYSDYSATCIPYWDNRCGEYFYNINDFEEKFNIFLGKLESYKPREYILENLSMDVCEKKFMNMINKINIS